jgi:(R)-amidase
MANRVGPGDSYAFSGGSQFADPFGQTLARIAGDAEGLLDVRLDPLAPGRARAQYRG